MGLIKTIKERRAQKADKEQGKKRSSKWGKVRKEWLAENGTCAACGSTSKLQVHHIESFHEHPEKELLKTNFITLCEVDPSGIIQRTLVAMHIRKPLQPGDKGNHHRNIGHNGNFKTNNPNVREDAAEHLKMVQSEPIPSTTYTSEKTAE
jgi:hypothetical protein